MAERSFSEKMKLVLKRDWKNLYFPQPETAEYPLAQMVQTLFQFRSDLDWARYYVFATDPIAGAIGPEDAAKLCRQALACGQTLARTLKERYPELTVREICQAEGADVSEELADFDGPQIRFAEFSKPNLIRINPECVKRAKALKEELPPESFLNRQEPADVLMAHELYHYLEEKDSSLFPVSYRHKTGRAALFGPAKVITLSEIAAGAFSRELAGLCHPAYLYDVVFTYCFHQKQAYRLYDRICEKLSKKEN